MIEQEIYGIDIIEIRGEGQGRRRWPKATIKVTLVEEGPGTVHQREPVADIKLQGLTAEQLWTLKQQLEELFMERVFANEVRSVGWAEKLGNYRDLLGWEPADSE